MQPWPRTVASRGRERCIVLSLFVPAFVDASHSRWMKAHSQFQHLKEMAPLWMLGQLVAAYLLMHPCEAASFFSNGSSLMLDTTPPPSAGRCFYKGREITSKEHLVGVPGTQSSIYGECHDGTLRCHRVSHSVNASVEEVACPSKPPPLRQLMRMGNADEVCMFRGKRIDGRQYLNGDPPYTFGSYFAICDEVKEVKEVKEERMLAGTDEAVLSGTKQAMLTCFRDHGAMDSSMPMHVLDCEDVPTPPSRQLGSWGAGIKVGVNEGGGRGGLWPQGVVCYVVKQLPKNLNQAFHKDSNPWDDAFDKHMDKFMKDLMIPTFKKYEQKTCLRFVEFDKCKTEAPGACNDCTHAVEIDASLTSASCFSSVGISKTRNTEEERLQRQRFSSYIPMDDPNAPRTIQQLAYGANDPNQRGPLPNCHLELNLLHEIGHTIGLLHDHQRPDRQVILNLDFTISDEKLRYQYVTNAQAWYNGWKSYSEPHPKKDEAMVKYNEAITLLNAHTGKMATDRYNLEIQAENTGGKYHMQSVMHYVGFNIGYHPICIPKKRDNELEVKDFCDFGQLAKCTRGRSFHCDKAATESTWSAERLVNEDELEKDFEAIKGLYSFVGGKCAAKK